MTKKKQTPKFIAENERNLAAKYFTLSNTAMLHMVRGNDLDFGYQQANDCMIMECGASLRDELIDWQDSIDDGNPYCFEEWERVKSQYLKEVV